MSSNHFDIIIIGTGIDGGTIAKSLAATGKKILILERGGFISKEKENWDPLEVVEKGRYRTKEKCFDNDKNAFEPLTHYAVGGNSEGYGTAAFRMREKDFTEYQTPAGISPAWPLSYTGFKPYFDQAEKFLYVHGVRNEDPTEPITNTAYPFPPIRVEPFTKELIDNVRSIGLKVYPIPMAVRLTEDNGIQDAPMVLGTFDGFPDLTESKSDAQILDKPALENANVTLLTNAKVIKLETEASGKAVSKVHIIINDEPIVFSCDMVIIGVWDFTADNPIINKQTKRAVFYIRSPSVKKCISLISSFNNWKPNEILLKLFANDTWYVDIPVLPEGKHEYKFFAYDSYWVEDISNPWRVIDNHGGWNNVFEISGN